MPYTLFIFLAALTAGHAHSADRGGYPAEKRGWFFYEPLSPERQKKEPEKKVRAKEVRAVQSAREKLEKMGEEAMEAMSVAYLSPTDENLREYFQRMHEITEGAKNFALVAKRFLWANPGFDHDVKISPHSGVRREMRQISRDSEQRQLKNIAAEAGLVYVFRSDCPYCRRFSPVMKELEKKHGFGVLPVTLDGRGVREYPDPGKDIALGRKLRVSRVPAVYLVRPEKNEVIPVSFGYSGIFRLEEKLLAAWQRVPGREETL